MFTSIAVIGAGTMGSAIAGQIANAGLRVRLLDLKQPVDANARSKAAVERLICSDPPALMDKSYAERIICGNIEDDLEYLHDCDWVIEAVVERLNIKQALYHRLDSIIGPKCIITSNTSTIPIKLLVEGLSADFASRFAITHYFNPVRYMRLLELVKGDKTDAKVMDKLAAFNEKMLGKGVVRCRDTPGFLGNRVGVFALQVGIDEAKKNQLEIEVADALMGRPMGIPKTGVFGLYDLIGIDLMADVVRSLRGILPLGDAFHAVGQENEMINTMITQGLTGGKSALGGFYRQIDGQAMARDLPSGDYRPRQPELPRRALTAARLQALNQDPLLSLIEGSDAQARFCQNVLARVLAYAASLLGEVTDSAQSIDDAMKLGFNWLRGPFEMIDAMGADKLVKLLLAMGEPVPVALAAKRAFYTVQSGELLVRHEDAKLHPVALPVGVIRFSMKRRTLTPIMENACASLFALKGDIRLIEFHSKANALTDESMQIVTAATEDHGRGIIVHNDAQHYSAGVDLNAFLALMKAQDWQGIDQFLAHFQAAVKALKYTPVPVVGAPSGLALGGGFEVLLHCDRLLAHSNCVLGLVESSVGLVPAGGGIKEAYLRWHAKLGDWQQAAWNTWMNIGYGATGSSPQMASKYQYYLPERDRSVMNRDRLLSQALAWIDDLSAQYQAPVAPRIMLAAENIEQKMARFMDEGIAREDYFAHDKTVAMQIASVICAEQAVELDEDALYQRERQAFIHLAKTPQTRARVEHLLTGRGTLRN